MFHKMYKSSRPFTPRRAPSRPFTPRRAPSRPFTPLHAPSRPFTPLHAPSRPFTPLHAPSRPFTPLHTPSGMASLAWRLLRNVAFLTIVVALCCDCYIYAGFMAFLPKFLEIQFQTSTYLANILSGIRSPLWIMLI